MAIVSYGPIVDGIRGSVGGVTFSRGQSGDTVRSKPRPPKPKKVNQIPIQIFQTIAAHKWQALTSAQQDDWNAYGATVDLYDSLGNLYHPSGINCLVWRLQFYKNAGVIAENYVRPTQDGVPVVPVLTFGYAAHVLSLVSVVPDMAVGEWLLLMIRRITRRNNFSRTLLRLKWSAPGGTGWPILLDGDYDEEWPAALDARAFIYWRFYDQFRRTSIKQLAKFDFTTV